MLGINLFNSIEKLRGGFVSEATEKSVAVNLYRTRHTIIHLKNNEVTKFIHKGDRIELHNHVNHIQIRGRDQHTAALLAIYCRYHEIPFNDPINTDHTLNAQKISQMMFLHLHKLPIPESIIVTSFSYESNYDYIKNAFTFPVVLKLNGDRGAQVWKIDSQEELDNRLLLSKEEKRDLLSDGRIPTAIIQEYIENTHDFRVTMYKNEILGVIKRISEDGFYNNWSLGAKFETSEISESESELCRRANHACGIDLAGTDFVRTENGPLFFEVNKSPQMNIDYSAIIARRIIEEYFN